MLRSPAHTLSVPVQLTYNIALLHSGRDPVATMDVYLVHRAHAQQTAATAHASLISRWSEGELERSETVCVPNGTYWLEFRATTGWRTTVFAVQRVHGGNALALACQPSPDATPATGETPRRPTRAHGSTLLSSKAF